MRPLFENEMNGQEREYETLLRFLFDQYRGGDEPFEFAQRRRDLYAYREIVAGRRPPADAHEFVRVQAVVGNLRYEYRDQFRRTESRDSNDWPKEG